MMERIKTSKLFVVLAFLLAITLLYRWSDRTDNEQAPWNRELPVDFARSRGLYRDGEYVGEIGNNVYALIQVKAVIKYGMLSDIQFLRVTPDDKDPLNQRGATKAINERALPILKSEAIAAQSSNVDGITGATGTTLAFQASLKSALESASSSYAFVK